MLKVKTKGSKILPNITYQWETVATNFDEFQDVSVSLFTINHSELPDKLHRILLLYDCHLSESVINSCYGIW